MRKYPESSAQNRRNKIAHSNSSRALPAPEPSKQRTVGNVFGCYCSFQKPTSSHYLKNKQTNKHKQTNTNLAAALCPLTRGASSATKITVSAAVTVDYDHLWHVRAGFGEIAEQPGRFRKQEPA